ncbi:OmpA/MotB family protein [Periweissella fabalis]|uniref:Flagellar motor protein MotB n=1 Tax=Periweissella fabalis TaxID=1070421 RepID=A0A7X6N4W5_9LACO|nr:flagellar motor protein MotB [Periweissella fabalis]MCM0599919.1 flagellar motor protein MotB [Periweissella fabalis]NKZ24025.1 flagellar motor protein MotB [Periweissella fabalis]
MRKKNKHEEEPSEAWLLPYSDMLTLLLALFIVLFAVSKVDTAKLQQLEAEFGSILASNPNSSLIAKSKNNAQGQPNNVIKPINSVNFKRQQEQQLLTRTFEETKKDINNSPLHDKVKITLQSDGIHLTLNSDILFDTASAAITSEMAKSLTLLAPHIKMLENNKFIIAGYTDNLPIQNNPQYASNWELSSARAISVMNYLTNAHVLAANKVTIEAFAENNPVATNDTAAGRAKNRRIEIIIQRKF